MEPKECLEFCRTVCLKKKKERKSSLYFHDLEERRTIGDRKDYFLLFASKPNTTPV
jgi:hypothetical protein